jgi:hypothetical protein
MRVWLVLLLAVGGTTVSGFAQTTHEQGTDVDGEVSVPLAARTQTSGLPPECPSLGRNLRDCQQQTSQKPTHRFKVCSGV